MKNILTHLQDGKLTKEEFDKLLFLSRRIFTDSAKKRFSKFDTNLDSNHPDFKKRIKINKQLASLIPVDQFIDYPEIKIIELGASFGVISSLAAIIHLLKNDYKGRIILTLLDLSLEPLERTKAVDFKLNNLLKELKAFDFLKQIIQILKESQIAKGSIVKFPSVIVKNKFDIVISAFTQHHLNLKDKEKACSAMEFIAKPGGIILIGDLTFNYSQYIKWLKKHSTERNSEGEKIPYAVESFISLDKHLKMFSNSKMINKIQGDIYYCFTLDHLPQYNQSFKV